MHRYAFAECTAGLKSKKMTGKWCVWQRDQIFSIFVYVYFLLQFFFCYLYVKCQLSPSIPPKPLLNGWFLIVIVAEVVLRKALNERVLDAENALNSNCYAVLLAILSFSPPPHMCAECAYVWWVFNLFSMYIQAIFSSTVGKIKHWKPGGFSVLYL